MTTQHSVAPRVAALEIQDPRREGRARIRRGWLTASIATLVAAAALGACSPGASGVPLPSVNLPSGLPSVDVSAAASAAGQAGLTALDQVDAAITANQTSGTLTADEASSLTQLSTALRTAITSGDTAGIKTALTNLTTKVDSFSAKLNTASGGQLTAAIAALKAALPSS